MPLFDTYVIVDWSAKNTPATGKDSIWIAVSEREGEIVTLKSCTNVATRKAAIAAVAVMLGTAQSQGKRVFAGFDFAFGYPSGAAGQMAAKPHWTGLWEALAEKIKDDANNQSNRFEVAAQLNRTYFDKSLFWGHPAGASFDGLEPTRPKSAHPFISHRRIVEGQVRSAKSVWQLFGNGSVGSQSLLGIAALQGLRNDENLKDSIQVWPFETRFAENIHGSILAEIYPSLIPVSVSDEQIKDAVQVETVAVRFAELDSKGQFGALLSAPSHLDDDSLNLVLQEEGWIVGADHDFVVAGSKGLLGYLREPQAIYEQSFATIRAEGNLTRFSKGMEDLAIRLIHACGMVDIADDLVFSEGAFEKGAAALVAGAPIFVDAEMVRHGIIRHLLPTENEVFCLLNDERVRPLSVEIGSTRSAAQVDLWGPALEGAVVAIGNAPTALFRLLELLDKGAPKPAIILGFPVGFVGAAESKEALALLDHGVPFIAVRGRRGGSAMASAAVNALAGGLGTNV